MNNAPPPQARYFGSNGAHLFGWLHRPPPASTSGFGLVICNPFGFEEVCAHRSLRHVAMAAAAAGIPTLRFDYAGCGNSGGDEFDPDMLGRWVQSVHEAADTLKQSCGVPGVCLLGLRLGATLAALAGRERDDVCGLVAIAPVLKGRSYIRELTILGEAGAAGPPGATSGGGLLESAGFVLTHETSEAIAGIDLRALDRRPAPRLLLVDRDDLPGAADWLEPLQRLQAEPCLVQWPGYRRMMDDPQRAQVPRQMIEGIVACLETWQSDPARQPVQLGEFGVASMTGAVPSHDGAGAVVETPVQIDAGGATLSGILTMAAGAERPAPGRPAILMLNSGSVHLIGPNRLWVRLARRWAARGVAVLRVDISGLGDSPPRPGAQENIVYSVHAAEDIAAALAYLGTQAGAEERHVMGLCSGAYHALKAAVSGQALDSSLMINPLTYFWKQGTEIDDVKDYEAKDLTLKYRRKLFTAEPWKKLLRGQLNIRSIAQVGAVRLRNLLAPLLVELARVLRIPFKNDLAAELAAATRRGIRLRFVFAARDPGYELLRKQGGRRLQPLLARQQASVDFIEGADHTFTRYEARERLVALLDGLMAPVLRNGSSRH